MLACVHASGRDRHARARRRPRAHGAEHRGHGALLRVDDPRSFARTARRRSAPRSCSCSSPPARSASPARSSARPRRWPPRGVRTSVLIANQLVGAAKLARLVALAQRPARADRRGRQRRAGRRARRRARGRAGVRLGALIEVDIGMHRCGTGRARGDGRARAAARGEPRRATAASWATRATRCSCPTPAKRKELAEAAQRAAARARRARCARRGSRPRSSPPAAPAPSS